MRHIPSILAHREALVARRRSSPSWEYRHHYQQDIVRPLQHFQRYDLPWADRTSNLYRAHLPQALCPPSPAHGGERKCPQNIYCPGHPVVQAVLTVESDKGNKLHPRPRRTSRVLHAITGIAEKSSQVGPSRGACAYVGVLGDRISAVPMPTLLGRGDSFSSFWSSWTPSLRHCRHRHSAKTPSSFSNHPGRSELACSPIP